MRKRAVGLGLVLAALAAVAGCGGDDGERLTTAELASRGDAVCNRLDAEVKEVASEFDSTITFTPDQMQQLFQKLVPKVDTAIADFEELTPPENLQAKYDAALAQVREDRKRLVAAGESQEAARALFEGGEDPFAATTTKLADVGITACSDDTGATEGDAGEGVTTSTSAPESEGTTTTSAP